MVKILALDKLNSLEHKTLQIQKIVETATAEERNNLISKVLPMAVTVYDELKHLKEQVKRSKI